MPHSNPCDLDHISAQRLNGRRRIVAGAVQPKRIDTDDDDVYSYIGERLKLEGETENRGI